MQGMRAQVHHPEKGDHMTAELGDIRRLKDLRVLLRSTNRRIARIRKRPLFLQSELDQEIKLAENIHYEIRKLEDDLIESDLGFVRCNAEKLR